MPSRTGRKTKLTPEVAGKILAGLRLGAFAHVAVEAAGVDYSTFKEWVARGEGLDPRRATRPEFAAFAAEVRIAKAEARQAAEWEVRKVNPLAWLRYGPGRERPGREGWTGEKTEVTGSGGGPVEHVVRVVRE